jgi:hypothetical protein
MVALASPVPTTRHKDYMETVMMSYYRVKKRIKKKKPDKVKLNSDKTKQEKLE